MIDDFEPILKELDTNDLIALQDLIANELDARTNNNVIGLTYNELRVKFYNRFTWNQIDHIFTWERLPAKKKAEFSKSLKRALRVFTKMKFKENAKLYDLIIRLVVESHFFENERFSWTLMTKSLDNIMVLFDRQFPGYNGTVYMTIFREHLAL